MLTLLLLMTQAFAVENLPCNRLLESGLAADEIRFIGRLEAYWETGMEDSTGWSIIDEHTRRWLSRNPYDSLFFLRNGDRILLTIDGVEYSGYFQDVRQPEDVTINGTVYKAYPNRAFLKDASGQEVMDQALFARAFFEGVPAEVIRKATPQEISELNRKYELWTKLHRQFAEKRRVELGYGQFHEAAYFSTLGRGQLSLDEEGRVFLEVPKGRTPLYFQDILYVDDGSELHKFEIDKYPYLADSKLRKLIERPHKALVIR